MAATNVQAFSGDVEISSNLTAASSKFSLDTNGTLKQVGVGANNNYIKLMKYFASASNWKIATGSYTTSSWQWLSIRAKMTRLDQDVETIQFNYFGNNGASRVRDSIVIGGGTADTQANEIKVYNRTSNSTYEIYLQIDSATSVEVEITHKGSTIDDDYSTVATANNGAIDETGLTKIYDSGTTTDLRLTGGNVGIGKTNPGSKLDVEGVLVAKDTAETQTLVIMAGDLGGGTNSNEYSPGHSHLGAVQIISEPANAGFSSMCVISKDRENNTTKNASIGFFTSDTSGTSKYVGKIGFWPEDANSINGQFRIYTGSGGGSGAGYTFPLQTMVVNSGGNVGIGEANPTYRLDVLGGTTRIRSSTTGGGYFELGGQETNPTTRLESVIYTAGTYINTPGSGAKYAKNVRFQPGSMYGGAMWATAGYGEPTLYGGDAVIYAGDVNASGNNGTGAGQYYGGNMYIGAGLAFAGAAQGSSARTYNGNIYFQTGTSYTFSSTDLSRYTRMTILTNGNVGIGSNNPNAPLDVHSTITGDIDVDDTWDGYLLTWSGVSQFDNYATNNVAVTADNNAGAIVAHVFLAGFSINFLSDRRIKKDIKEIDDESALEKFRLLKPSKYKYIEPLLSGRTDKEVYGYIAQEVAEVLPEAVTICDSDEKTNQGHIPNIMSMCRIESQSISYDAYDILDAEQKSEYIETGNTYTRHVVTITETVDLDTFSVIDSTPRYKISNQTKTTGAFEKRSDGEYHPLIFYSKNLQTIRANIVRVIDDSSFVVGENLLDVHKFKNDKLLLYGQKPNDFHRLNKDAIFTLATAALQEVDRQLQAEKAKVASLETQLTSVLARLDALEGA